MVEPKNLATGYYRVRSGKRWVVARWKPAQGRWEVGCDRIYIPGYWDQIAEKVA